MRKKKLAAGMAAAVMALTMCMGTGVTVFADDPVDLSGVRGAVKKELIMDENVTAPNATFKFKIEKATGTVTDENGKDVTEFLSTDGPELSIEPVIITKGAAGKTEDGIKTVSGEGRIRTADGSKLEADYFGHPGVFAYKVTEESNTYNITDPSKEKMTYSKAEYIVFITIANRADYGGGLEIESIQGMITVDDTGTDIKDEKVHSTEPGSTDLAFQNIYSKTGGTDEWDPKLGALSVSKKVTGKYGDHEKFFDFSLTLYKNATLDQEVAQSDNKIYPTYTVNLPDGRTLEYQFDAKTDEITKTFKLKDKQNITFDDVPVGTKFTLSENDGKKITNYNTTINGKSDDIAFTENAMTISEKLVGEGANYADVVNDYDENPVTGIVVKNLPFFLLIGAAVLGFAAYIAVKRRRFVK